MVNLGKLHGSSGDMARAEHWCKAAADLGDAEAACLYAVALGSRGDRDGAREWLRRAAWRGSETAPAMLRDLESI